MRKRVVERGDDICPWHRTRDIRVKIQGILSPVING